MMDKDQRERLRRKRREAAEAATYDTGYGKPPANTRFSSTNQPQKNRKDRRSPAERSAEIADEIVNLKINGVARKITLHDAIVRKIALDAISGKTQAARLWLTQISSNKKPRLSSYPNIDYAEEVRRKLEAMGVIEDQRKAAARLEQDAQVAAVAGDAPPCEHPQDD